LVKISVEELAIRQRLKDDFPHYAAKCLRIRTKAGAIQPFTLNIAQAYIHQKVEQQRALTGKVRALILKGRQMGCTTLIQGRYYWRVTHSRGKRAFILTHEEEATNNLFEMAKRYHDHCPTPVKPTTKTSNSKELIFDGLDSGYKLGTAGNKSVGRSSTIQFLHASEVAFWKHADEHAKGIFQTVPDEAGTEIFCESTANGTGNWFHQQYQLAEAGLSDYIAIFVPWYWQPEYRREIPFDFSPTIEEEELKNLYNLDDYQLAWRRNKIVSLSVNGIDGTKAFKQEYPCNSTEAFQSTGEDNFILPDLVMKARKTKVEAIGPLLLGVDPARFGDDRTAIVRRQGRKIFKKQTYIKKDTMEVAGYVHRIIIEENPARVFIDVGGLGAGVYDRLIELGYGDIVVPVNSGAVPLDQVKYYNKRAEMWGTFKNWLTDEPCEIPDDDELHADICGPKYKWDSNSRLLIEKKEEMKKRGIRSSDTADACILTFALPMSAISKDKKKEQEKASIITRQARAIKAIRRNR
jgi:hypothetical protein